MAMLGMLRAHSVEIMPFFNIDTIEQQRQPAAGAGGKIKDFFRSLLGG